MPWAYLGNAAGGRRHIGDIFPIISSVLIVQILSKDNRLFKTLHASGSHVAR